MRSNKHIHYAGVLISLLISSYCHGQRQNREYYSVEFSSKTATKVEYAQYFAQGPYSKPCFPYTGYGKTIHLLGPESLLPGTINFKLYSPINRFGMNFNCSIDWISWIIKNESAVVLKYRFRVGGYENDWSYWEFINPNTVITIGQFDPGRNARIEFEIAYHEGVWLWGTAPVRINGEMGICIK